MKKIAIILTFLLIISSYSGFAQEDKTSKETSKSENTELQKELGLTDTEFTKKYIEKLGSANDDFLYQSYITFEDTEVKMAILKLSQKKISNPTITKIYRTALEEGIWNENQAKKQNISDQWKVRASAAYFIHENAGSVTSNKNLKVMFTRILIARMYLDPEERCRAMAVLTLAKLYEKDSETSESKSYNLHTLKKEVIVDIITDRLRRVSISDQFLCWALVKSLGYLKSKRAFFILLETRKRGFNIKVMLEISKSMQAIVGSGSTGGNSSSGDKDKEDNK